MAKPKRQPKPGDWNASQVVAHNLTKARELRGLTQAEVAERLSRFTGTNWSQVTVAQAEASVAGTRIRQFSAVELVALARTFDLPVLFFFLPPDDGSGQLVTDDSAIRLPWEYLLLVVFGHRDNFPLVADRMANWSDVFRLGVSVPRSDAMPDDNERLRLFRNIQRRIVEPEDILAAAFHGLAARRMRGAQRPGKDVATFASNLRGLADALDAFNNYRPGTFVKDDLVSDIAAQRQEKEDRLQAAFDRRGDHDHNAEDEDDDE